jgi:hypothetical protein
MKHAMLAAGLGAAMAVGLMTTSATAAPVGPVSAPAAATGNDLVVQARYYGRGGYGYGYRYRRGPAIGLFLGGSALAYGRGYSSCYYSHRYGRRICSY